ncbi:MAG: N-acetyltransferase [Afipia sp.]|nr:N-acetyltransferase [Afipia sp.]
MLAGIETELAPAELGRFTDILRLRSGKPLTVRFVAPDDADALQSYFRALSQNARYRRLMGGASELPPSELDKATHVGAHNIFAVVAEIGIDGVDVIAGEACYAFDPDVCAVEFGISIADRFQGQGIGAAILTNLECRAAALGAVRLIGDTLRNNEAMIALARKLAFEFKPTPGDWKQVRFEKRLVQSVADIPCESWRIAASRSFAANAVSAAV